VTNHFSPWLLKQERGAFTILLKGHAESVMLSQLALIFQTKVGFNDESLLRKGWQRFHPQFNRPLGLLACDLWVLWASDP